jgi:hypothetical protein
MPSVSQLIQPEQQQRRRAGKDPRTTIRAHKSTVDLIDSLGYRGETYEDILLRLLTPLRERKKSNLERDRDREDGIQEGRS